MLVSIGGPGEVQESDTPGTVQNGLEGGPEIRVLTARSSWNGDTIETIGVDWTDAGETAGTQHRYPARLRVLAVMQGLWERISAMIPGRLNAASKDCRTRMARTWGTRALDPDPPVFYTVNG